MPAPLRVVVAITVLVAGIACAALFRRDERNPPPTAAEHLSEPAGSTVEVGPIKPNHSTQQSTRKQLGDSRSPFRYLPGPNINAGGFPAGTHSTVPAPSPTERSEGSELEAARPPSPRATVPIPSMAPKFPGAGDLRPNRVGDLPPTSASRCDRRTHRVTDGDTLETIAKRYLGSAEHAIAIREANSEVLPDPNVLPIGIELVIPPLPTGRLTSAPPAPSSASKKQAEKGHTDLGRRERGTAGAGESPPRPFEQPMAKQAPEPSGPPAAIVWPSSNSRAQTKSQPAVDGWEPAER